MHNHSLGTRLGGHDPAVVRAHSFQAFVCVTPNSPSAAEVSHGVEASQGDLGLEQRL